MTQTVVYGCFDKCTVFFKQALIYHKFEEKSRFWLYTKKTFCFCMQPHRIAAGMELRRYVSQLESAAAAAVSCI